MESKQKFGTVKAWNVERAFGYIRALNGKDYFTHIRYWLSDEPPTIGQKVVFELGPGITATKPPQAINVRLQTEIETGANALASQKTGGAE
jgi:cold shock CspA family protein